MGLFLKSHLKFPFLLLVLIVSCPLLPFLTARKILKPTLTKVGGRRGEQRRPLAAPLHTWSGSNALGGAPERGRWHGKGGTKRCGAGHWGSEVGLGLPAGSATGCSPKRALSMERAAASLVPTVESCFGCRGAAESAGVNPGCPAPATPGCLLGPCSNRTDWGDSPAWLGFEENLGFPSVWELLGVSWLLFTSLSLFLRWPRPPSPHVAPELCSAGTNQNRVCSGLGKHPPGTDPTTDLSAPFPWGHLALTAHPSTQALPCLGHGPCEGLQAALLWSLPGSAHV